MTEQTEEPRKKGKRRNPQVRVLVTISPELKELLTAVGNECDVKVSRMIGQMLEQARPGFEAMLEAARIAKSTKEESLASFHKLILTAQSNMNALQMDLLSVEKERNEAIRAAKKAKKG